MRLYLDTADRAAAEDLLGTGLFAGLTTNPIILRRAGLDGSAVPEIYRWATAAGAKEVFFQAWGREPAMLVAKGRELRALGPEVVVKVPASLAGAEACAQLSVAGIPTLLTAVYAPSQVLLAVTAGAAYLAPYLARMTDAGRAGLPDVAAMQQMLTATTSRTKLLLASIRDVSSIVEMAKVGVDRFTMAPSIAELLFADDLTAAAVDAFEAAAA